MINIEEFKKIRRENHLIVLDTNILLELYRQPANISIDVIDVLERIIDKIYIPRQVYNEYIKNYQTICGSEKKKYQRVSTELSQEVRKFQESIDAKIREYRKHNYTDIVELQNNLNNKLIEITAIVDEYVNSHKEEIDFNLEFLENDKVKEFVERLKNQNCIGDDISFSGKIKILNEGKIRYDNLIPPGYLDSEKEGMDKFGDLFVWKDMISIAKNKNANLIFVCNDFKEDWWEKDKETLIDLRKELCKEFKESNYFLDIHFLTLEKFFSYITEELKMGKSKSALQLSAEEDAKIMLSDYDEAIYQKIVEYLVTLDIEEELNEKLIDAEEEDIYWDIWDVSVDKDNKKIIYYVNLAISVIANLTYQEDGNYPIDVGVIAIDMEGKLEIEKEEYATSSELRAITVEKNDILHIEPEVWNYISKSYYGKPCKSIIATCRNLEKSLRKIAYFNENMKKVKDNPIMQKLLQNIEKLKDSMDYIGDFSTIISPTELIDKLNTISKESTPLYVIKEQPQSFALLQKVDEYIKENDGELKSKNESD